MITGIATLSKEDIIPNEAIKYRREHEYCYGVPYLAEIGIRTSVSLKSGDEVLLYDSKHDPIEVKLLKVHTEAIEQTPVEIYTFVDKLFFDLLNSSLPETREVFSVSLNDFIIGSEGQLDYLILGLRKKSLFFALESKKAKQLHVKEVSSGEAIQLSLNDYRVQKLEDQNHKPNYFTLLDDGSVAQTSNGKGAHIFIPFLTKEEISGLDVFLVPEIMLKTSFETSLKIGDVVDIEKEIYVVMEVEKFGYAEQLVSSITLGS